METRATIWQAVKPPSFAILRRNSIKRCLILTVSLPILVFTSFYLLVALLPYPSILSLTKPASTWINDRNGVALAARVASDDQWRIPLHDEAISHHLMNAIVAVEDERFFDHHGVDWKSVAGSLGDNVSSLRTRRGASTLSMQLIRLRLPTSRNLRNKFLQAIRAQQLEERSTKQQILIDYINEAPFGGNLVGAGAASWRYFGKPCEQLSLAEAALLAGLPQRPNYLRPDLYPDRAKIRRDLVLRRMLRLGKINDSAYANAVGEPVKASWNLLPQMKDASDGALPTLLRMAELYRGQTVNLTLDPAVQQTAAAMARDHLQLLQSNGVNSAAVVVLDTQTAELLAAVSLNDGRSKVDLTRAMRSSGSTLKPFIYAAAVDAGLITMTSKLQDSPKAWAQYVPANFDRSFRGELTAGDALAESRNIPAMAILSRVGVARTINVMSACGIQSIARSPQRYGLPLAIGGAEVSPLELAEAYATLARGGVHREIQLVSGSSASGSLSPRERVRVRVRNETDAHSHTDASLSTSVQPQSVRPLTPALSQGEREMSFASSRYLSNQSTPLSTESCLQVLASLSNPDRTRAISPEAAQSHVAWKTGTSSGRRDAWCAAVTPNRTVIVWLGNDNGKGSTVLIGTDAAAPLALKLIATLDPNSKGFAAPSTGTNTLAVAPLQKSSLTILSPANGEVLMLDPDARSSVALKAHHSQANEKLWWFVDGNATESDSWNPTPGSHEIRVVDANGTSATSKVKVQNQ